MNSVHRQRGMTAIGWLVVLVFVGIVALAAIRLVPIYMEHFSVTTSLKSLTTEHTQTISGPADIRELLEKRLEINDVSHVNRDDVSISRAEGGYDVAIDYEARVPFLANIDFVVSFHNEVEVPTH